MKNKQTQKPLELVGAKIPHDIKDAIERQAIEEERSVSQTISRLLSTHPALIKATKKTKSAKTSV